MQKGLNRGQVEGLRRAEVCMHSVLIVVLFSTLIRTTAVHSRSRPS